MGDHFSPGHPDDPDPVGDFLAGISLLLLAALFVWAMWKCP